MPGFFISKTRSLSDLGGRREDKSGLSQILSSFKEHVILFDEKELKMWPNPDFPQ